MLKFLKDAWKDAQQRVEEEDKARAAAKAAARPGGAGPDMTALAQKFAESLKAKGVLLDFKPSSLAVIDRVLAAAKGDLKNMSAADKRNVENHACVSIGAYVGEVVRREEGGVWVQGDDGLPRVDLGSHLAPVVAVVLGLFEHGRVRMPDGPVETLTAYYNAVSKMARVALEQVVSGGSKDLQTLMCEMSADGELAKWLAVQAQLAVKTAGTKWSTPLDFSPKSLDGVERILSELHDLLKTAPPGDRPTDKQIEGAAIIWGVYVGEVIRRHYGGKWALSKPDGALQLEIEKATIFPLRKVQKRLVDGPGDAVPFYFNAMRVALAQR